MTGSRQRGWAILVAAIAVIATACGGPKAHPAPKPKPTPPPAAPAVGACRNLTFASAAAASDDTPTVPCTSRHTAITVAVGTLVAKSQVKHLDINAPAVQQLLAVSCPHAVETYTGARAGIFDLSQIQAIPFVPTPTQIARGANWYRCDLVVLAAPNTLARVLGTMHLALKPARALDRWGTCGNTSPSSASFRRELCSRPHHWRAVSLVSLPKNATYLAPKTTRVASASCRKIAAKAAHGALKYSWSFEWPNKQQWQAGDRFGLCWLPRSD